MLSSSKPRRFANTQPTIGTKKVTLRSRMACTMAAASAFSSGDVLEPIIIAMQLEDAAVTCANAARSPSNEKAARCSSLSSRCAMRPAKVITSG